MVYVFGRVTFSMFDDLATMFLNHFQFPVHYDTIYEILANFE